MAQGPDPNRHTQTDRENTGDEQRAGGGLGDPRSSRLGLSSGAIAVVAVLVGLGILLLLF